MRSQRYFYENEKKRPIQMMAYIQFPSLVSVLRTIVTATVFGLFATFRIGRSLLEKVMEFVLSLLLSTITYDGNFE